MRVVLAIAAKELRDILRERTILVSLLVQFFVAGFSAFLSVGLTGLYDPAAIEAFPESDVAYAGEGGFDGYLTARNLDVERMPVESALEAFREGRLQAVVEETVDADGVHHLGILLPDGTIEATLLLTQFKGMLQEYETDLREANQARLVQDLVTAPQPTSHRGASYAFTYATLVPLLILTPVFLSGAIAGDAFVHEVQTRTLLILRSTPASGSALLAGKLLVPVLLAPAQVGLWLGLLRLNDILVPGWPLVLAAALLLALLMAGIGIALASLIRHEGQVQATYALVVLVLSVASLLLPNDPLNLLALAATNAMTPPAWLTLGAWTVAATLSAGLGLPFAARRIRRDEV